MRKFLIITFSLVIAACNKTTIITPDEFTTNETEILNFAPKKYPKYIDYSVCIIDALTQYKLTLNIIEQNEIYTGSIYLPPRSEVLEGKFCVLWSDDLLLPGNKEVWGGENNSYFESTIIDFSPDIADSGWILVFKNGSWKQTGMIVDESAGGLTEIGEFKIESK